MAKRRTKKSTRVKTTRATKTTKRKSTTRRSRSGNPFEINNVQTLI